MKVTPKLRLPELSCKTLNDILSISKSYMQLPFSFMIWKKFFVYKEKSRPETEEKSDTFICSTYLVTSKYPWRTFVLNFSKLSISRQESVSKHMWLLQVGWNIGPERGPNWGISGHDFFGGHLTYLKGLSISIVDDYFPTMT